MSNFTKEILVECESEDAMNQMEASIVDDDFVNRSDTYNVMVGGQGGGKTNWDVGRKRLVELLSDGDFYNEFCKRTSEGLKNYHKSHANTFLGRSHSEESKKKMRMAKIGKCDGENNPMFGMMWINNGAESTRIKKTDTIPIGYKKGRLVKKSS